MSSCQASAWARSCRIRSTRHALGRRVVETTTRGPIDGSHRPASPLPKPSATVSAWKPLSADAGRSRHQKTIATTKKQGRSGLAFRLVDEAEQRVDGLQLLAIEGPALSHALQRHLKSVDIDDPLHAV